MAGPGEAVKGPIFWCYEVFLTLPRFYLYMCTLCLLLTLLGKEFSEPGHLSSENSLTSKRGRHIVYNNNNNNKLWFLNAL